MNRPGLPVRWFLNPWLTGPWQARASTACEPVAKTSKRRMIVITNWHTIMQSHNTLYPISDVLDLQIIAAF